MEQTSSHPLKKRKLDGIKVLVVDDQHDARYMVERILKMQGAIVRSSGSAEDAMLEVSNFHPEIIVSDLAMPGQDGLDLIRTLRLHELHNGAAAPIPAIAVSGHCDHEDQQISFEAGFQAHLGKPVNIAELVATIARLALQELRAPAHPL